jgi:hypothetical protein
VSALWLVCGALSDGGLGHAEVFVDDGEGGGGVSGVSAPVALRVRKPAGCSVFVTARRRYPPCTRSSFCLAKRNQKRRPGSSAPACGWGSLCCSFRGAAGLNSLRSLRSLRSDSNPGSVHKARFARAPLHCAARRFRTGQQPEQPNTEQPGLQPDAPFPGCWRLGCSPRSEAPSSTAGSGAGVSPLQVLTPPDCLTAVSAANGGSFGRAGAGEQRRESWPPARTLEPGQALFPPFGKTKGGRGAGAKRPAGCNEKTPNRHTSAGAPR